jgi:serine/threonine-protein kinase
LDVDTGEDIGPGDTTQPYIVMEYVEGRTLRDILKAEGRLPVRRAMEIAADVCGALDFSHRNGIVHRDIKPANVMITPQGAVKVMDFGIARAVADTSSTVTQTANVIGTAQYLSPEQARGETVDGRSDVYSTGCLLYELVTGVPPFQGDSPVAVAYQHVRENAPTPSSRVPDVPRVLDSIVMKAIAKNVLNRYQTAGEMRGDLQRALADQPITAEAVMTDAERTQFIQRTPVPPLVPRTDPAAEYDEPERRTGLIWGLIIAALLLVIVAGVGAVLLVQNSGNGTPKFTVPTGLIGALPEADRQKLGTGAVFTPNQNGATTNGPCDDGSTPPASKVGVVCKLTDSNGAKVTAGESIVKGSTIYYQTYIQAKVNVPYVTGETVQQAITDLQKANLGVGTIKTVNNKAAPNTVLSQSEPVNTQVPPGTNIGLTVSNGEVTLPNIEGLTFQAAMQKLNNLGYTQVSLSTDQSQSTTDPTKKNEMYTTTPGPGTYTVGTPIIVIPYKYVPPTPSCTSGAPSSPTDSSSPSTSPSAGDSSSSLPPCTSSS